MTATMSEIERKEFQPGTTGWTADDLDDPSYDQLWASGRYEIVEGVLTIMPPAYLDGGIALQNLIFLLQLHVREKSPGGKFAPEADLIVTGKRVARSDAAYLSVEDLRRQELANRECRKPTFRYGRLRVPPTLIIKAVSLGHEVHDRETKWQWYAEFGVPNYWLLDPQRRSLECLMLDGGTYRRDVQGRNNDIIRPTLFEDLTIPLGEIWT